MKEMQALLADDGELKQPTDISESASNNILFDADFFSRIKDFTGFIGALLLALIFLVNFEARVLIFIIFLIGSFAAFVVIEVRDFFRFLSRTFHPDENQDHQGYSVQDWYRVRDREAFQELIQHNGRERP